MTLGSSDQPIVTHQADRLGRAFFANYLAQRIASHANSEPLVVALYGPWGSGKTSVLYLVQESLAKQSADPSKSPLVVRFNPWNFQSVDQLISMFFREIRLVIQKEEPGKASERVGRSLETLGTVFSWAESLPYIGFLGKISKLSTGVGHLLRKDSRSLEQIRKELNSGLMDLKRRIVIMIDDMDRLETDQLLVMLRLIRLNANLPYATYLLAFDRAVVEQALNNAEHAITGKDYLDKIVQVGLDLPAISPEHLYKMFSEELGTVIGPVPEEEWDMTRWRQMFAESIRHFLVTPRDIVRYVNGLRLTLPLVQSEVNVVDFVGLEAIRTFKPSLYNYVYANVDVFNYTANAHSLDRLPSFRTKVKSEIEGIVGPVAPHVDNPWIRLLGHLFPRTSEILGGPTYAVDSYLPNWRRERRVCTTEYFDTYFRLQLPQGALSELELKEFVKNASEYATLEKPMREMLAGKHVRQLQRYLDDHKGELSLPQVQNLIRVIFAVGDALESRSAGMLDLSELQYMGFLVADLFARVSESDERMGLLGRMLETPNSLILGVWFVSLLEQATDRERFVDQEGRPVFARETILEARHALLGRIRESASAGTLLPMPDPLSMLFRWHDWAGEGGVEEIRRYLAEMTATDAGLRQVLVAFMSEIKSEQGYEVKRIRYVKKDYLGKFLDMPSLTAKVEALSERQPPGLTETERTAIETFLKPPPEARRFEDG